MANLALVAKNSKSIPIHFIAKGEMDKSNLDKAAKNWAKSNLFNGEAQRILLVPNEEGEISCVLFGLGQEEAGLNTGALGDVLPKGKYHFEDESKDMYLPALGFLLGGYTYTQYKKSKQEQAKLVLPKGVDEEKLRREVGASFLARDLINTPANDMGPQQLEDTIRQLANDNKAKITVIEGDKLLNENFPMVHAVGRASVNAPRLIDLTWGNTSDPKVTLVGKGVSFDTGGLNIKVGAGMTLMKKDMGGAANTIALAKMIMEAKLPVRLRLIIPAVENSISANAFRPGDILNSRKGLTVEIGNTDAEGRLILADALALGDEEKPDLMIDMATLTGAARVALGPDLPPFYSDDDTLVKSIVQAAHDQDDPLWQMPLWKPYNKTLSSKIADVNHISTGGYAGSITAALFLSKFVEHANAWAHFDIFGWVPTKKSWAPVGGEAQGIRALFQVISNRYV